jgi:NAD(P)-dependent dehydrogenase (short-subunit alcohol dehydrogenase family)
VSDFRLDGKAAIVTGASSGIGFATAEAMAAAGARLVLCGRDEERLARCAERVGEHRVVAVDINAEAAPELIVDAAVDAFGTIDVLVHSAGIFEPAPFTETSADSFDRQWRTNVRAPFLLTQRAASHLRAGGSVIFISSIAGHVAFPSSAAYCASKGAVELMAKALATELSPLGVRVNVIAPGNIRTAMNAALRAQPGYEERMGELTPAGRHGEPEEIAAAVVFVASDAASFVHGASFLVDGGWTAR